MSTPCVAPKPYPHDGALQRRRSCFESEECDVVRVLARERIQHVERELNGLATSPAARDRGQDRGARVAVRCMARKEQ